LQAYNSIAKLQVINFTVYMYCFIQLKKKIADIFFFSDLFKID